MIHFTDIEDVLGLHQTLTIIYVVDGYEATLYTDDEKSYIIRVTKPTIYECLYEINEYVGGRG